QGGAERGDRARQELRRHRGPPLRERRAREDRHRAAPGRGRESKNPNRLNEFELIRRYFTRRPKHAGRGVIRGVGDDCAQVRGRAGHDLVITTDLLIAGRHFRHGAEPRALGHKALAVNLSDLAAGGATPRWFVLAIALPAADPYWLKEFSKGLFT